ncbi:MAG TPA: molybdopterin-dependent oxidoreductase [Bacteroidales bacterium]|nr:molybdopterin-dependent oxidoreductase [Bacteroidales bacterium]
MKNTHSKLFQKKNLVFICLLLVVVISAIFVLKPKYPNVDWTITFSGNFDQPVELTYADLAKMTQSELNEILMEKTTSEDTIDSWSGPSLKEVITQIEADPNFAYMSVLADDGYQAVLVPSELDDAIFALKKDGEWIAETDMAHGPIRLVCPKTPANKWVYAILEIQFS